MCVSSFSQPTNYCPEEPTAVATVVFFFTTIPLPSSVPPLSWRGGGGESGGSLSHGSCSLGESLHHCGTLSHTHTHTHAQSNTQLVSSVSFYLSQRHYTLQLSLWPSLWGFDAHTHTHTHSSNPNVPSMFVITLSPDGTRPIGYFFFYIIESGCIEATLHPPSCVSFL